MADKTDSCCVPLISSDVVIRVSSTLDKSTGRKYLIDQNPETCWTSAEGLPQFVHFIFPKSVLAKRLYLTFQGGFVGTVCKIQVKNHEEERGEGRGGTNGWRVWTTIFPEDVNRKQIFELHSVLEYGSFTELRMVFEESSDFFGRITLYDVQLDGNQVTKT